MGQSISNALTGIEPPTLSRELTLKDENAFYKTFENDEFVQRDH